MKILPNLNKILILLSITSLVSSLDFISKQFIINHFSLFEIKSINSVLNIFHTHNYGLAFSLFSNISKKNKYLLCLINVITIIIVSKNLYIIPIKKIYYNISHALIIGGAIGNLIDRIRFGFVIDFIDIHYNNWHFATFNIADINIFLGSIIIMYFFFFIKEQQ
ncbi:MAG: signal peptidase II [Buchnera aphidicola (Schlechtendalia peitan)]